MSTLARRALLITAALSVISCAHAQTVTGSGRSVTETRTVSGFEAVQLEASMKLVLRQGTQEAVQVQADDNLVPLIETLVETRGSLPTLVVRWKRNTSIRSQQALVVTVDAVRVRALSASGSGSIEAATLKTDRLRLNVAGSGDVQVKELAADDVEASIAGSGDVKAGGRAARVKVSIAGSGDADLSNLNADDVKVSIAGSGDAKVSADQALSVSIAGSGDVRYGGKVTAVKTSIVGSGDVRRR
ncbi:MAG: DUF2807 domain-containing protein [Rubrivivax sp.]|nr:DUF2807 domain-containing protein [Rubrivivax sp.]